MNDMVHKVATKNGIPFDHVIQADRYINNQPNTMADAIHPNEKGYGILAQEIYMRMAYSSSYMQL